MKKMSTQMIVAIRIMDTIIQATIICECGGQVKRGENWNCCEQQ